MVICISFHFKRKLGQESNFTLLVRDTILNAIKLLFKQFSDRSQSSIFPSRSSALRHVHLKIKMASINGKTRYISTISRKNRALWTVSQSFFVKYLNVEYLHVMSILCTTEWWSELTTWSQKMNLLHNLSTSPHCLHKHCIWARNENFNFDLRVCYLLRHKWHQLRKSRENDFLGVVIIGRFFVMNLCCS